MKKIIVIIGFAFMALKTNAQTNIPPHQGYKRMGYSSYDIQDSIPVYEKSIGAPLIAGYAVELFINSQDNLASDTTAKMTINYMLTDRNVKLLTRGKVIISGNDYSNMNSSNSKIAAWVANKIGVQLK